MTLISGVVSFTELFDDWEVEEAERILCELERFVLADEIENEVRWMLTKSGVFSVKSMFTLCNLA